jgi:L-threonylcarbamoyladenylate synthase
LAVIAAGFAVLFAGLVLAVLPMIPGGLPGIVLGLTILSTELGWARRLRAKVLRTARLGLPNVTRGRAARFLAGGRNSLGGASSGRPVQVGATSEGVAQAADVLRRGGLVAFPTETVYGLGAAAFNRSAVARIFEVKGRPPDNPLIVHVSSREMLESVAGAVPDVAGRLIDAFWPGPLTLVLRRSARVPGIVSAGLDTVAVRAPAHPVALQLIRLARQPVAAPSANQSGRPSPTSAAHVIRDLGAAVDLLIDDGHTPIGVESTVLDVSGPAPVLLRPGGVSKEQIEQILGHELHPRPAAAQARSPGMRHRHYAPACRVIAVDPGEWRTALERAQQAGERVGVITRTPLEFDERDVVYRRHISGGLAAYACHLFAAFREAEEAAVDSLLVETVEEEGIGLAVMDRLRRAAAIEEELTGSGGADLSEGGYSWRLK